MSGDKKADLAGPGVSTYEEVEKILPKDYQPLLTPMERMKGVFIIKKHIEQNLCRELNLQMVQVLLIVEASAGWSNVRPLPLPGTARDLTCNLGLDWDDCGRVNVPMRRVMYMCVSILGLAPPARVDRGGAA